MSTIVTRAGKGSPLTSTEVDSNFTNLNTDKLEDITGESIKDLSDVNSLMSPADGQVLTWDNANTRWSSADSTGGIADVVDDTTPQLGGDLDVNGFSIVSTANADINITPNGTGSVVVTGNITVSGTVDGRDIATDGTKLDGIESNATADQTASEIMTAIQTVDGTGSGLDADLLDGQHGSYYQPASTALTTSTFFGGDVSGSYDNIQIRGNSVGITELDVTDGTSGQVLTTDGRGTLSFADASGGGISSGTTAQRPTSPSVGDIRYNTDERQFEAYRNQIDSSVADDWYPLSPWELIEEGSVTGLNTANPFVIGSRYYPNESVTGRENFTYTSFRADIAYQTDSSNSLSIRPVFYFGYETPVNSTGGSVTGFTVEGVRYRREWNAGTSTSTLQNHINQPGGDWTPVVYTQQAGVSGSGTVQWGTNFGNTIVGTCHFESMFAYCTTSSSHEWCKVVGAMEAGTFWYNQSPCLYLSSTSSTDYIDVQYRLYGLRGIS